MDHMEVCQTPGTQMVLHIPNSNPPVRSNKRKEREHGDAHAAKKDTNGQFVSYAEQLHRGYGWVSH